MLKKPKDRLLKKIESTGVAETVRTLGQFVARRMGEMEIREVSSTMALGTLLAIVPLMALLLALFTAFPGFADMRQSLEDLILGSFLPEQYSTEIVRYIKQLSSHSAGLTTFGFLGLAFTAIGLINKLFITLNRIFKVDRMRPWPQRVLIYWFLVTVGPIMVGVSLTLTGRAAALALEGVSSGISSFLLGLGQMLMQALAFALIYKFIPNCRVYFSHALVGGAVVTVLGQVVRIGFRYYIGSGSLANIYGAFVALPVMVLWVYIAWYLFFAGAAVTATIPKLVGGRFKDAYRAGNDFLTALAMLRALVGLRAGGGKPVMTIDQLCEAADSYPEAGSRVMATLAAAGYTARVDTSGREEAWALIADTRRDTLLAAFEAFSVDGKNTLVAGEAGQKTSAGVLASWWQDFCGSAALTMPLASVLGGQHPGRPS